MSERELAAMFFGGWIAGAVAITFAMLWIESKRRRDRCELDNRVLVQDEVLRNIVKQSASLAEIAAELRVIAEVVMCLDTSVGKEERQ